MSRAENTAPRVVLLSGGVGGARLARGLQEVVPPDRFTVIVNVGDDEELYGVYISPDVDTVLYTMAGVAGQYGWGLDGDTFEEMELLSRARVDTRFRMGDRDLANSRERKRATSTGVPLSAFTSRQAERLGVRAAVVPATDDRLRTRVQTDGGWLDFQEYFVFRRHEDEVTGLEFAGADYARPAPGTVEAIVAADLVVIGPSNPPLSIWPILAIDDIRAAVAAASRVVAVSPLFGGKALKGPADRVMASLGLPPGTAGVAAAYEGLLTDLVIDDSDAADATVVGGEIAVHVTATRILEPANAVRFAGWLVAL